MEPKTVLVTGATGYAAGHIVLQLLRKGYNVRGTVRSLSNTKKYEYITELKEKYPHYGSKVELVEADLMDSTCWDNAVSGCQFVMHVASPFFTRLPKHEDEMIKPAVDGTLSVLKACAQNHVEKVVMTSSGVSIKVGQVESRVYNEEDWGIVDKNSNAYMKSKYLAEKAAWEYVEALPEDQKFAFTTILPTFIGGAPLTSAEFASGEVYGRAMSGGLSWAPDLYFDFVDVRDVATAHLAALENPKADGNRYLCTSDNYHVSEFISILAAEFNQYGYNLKTRQIPTWVLCLIAPFSRRVWEFLPEIGRRRIMSNDKIRADLGMEFRSPKETIVEMGYDIIAMGKAKEDKTEGVAQARRSTLEKIMAEKLQI
eukprot:CAMPEP_0115000452 /NCGR_PEP_ID=MMETSP0216-20121206/16769_1 /TAXON_ID=223996 /ORGANISM="Protocruzia adherens, Strain Boccale" /LENGTH=369 /DNA_ID=CAMNT_0002365559 /DNA_START=48 /DNA_END=1157 /DNA_ORIENTATION=-